MKLHEITANHPIVIDLVNDKISDKEPVFFSLVGHKKRQKQLRIVSITTEPYTDSVGITRYTVTFVNFDSDPEDATVQKESVDIPDRYVALATLTRQKDGAWSLNMPFHTRYDELPPA